ncbi:MAG: PhzF family phenazine biosynthesis protein [Polycyclovorans sp.]|jgi:predicted PhzF superfamily epimerase YddE/YHI9|nr:PhzF family phenazine biosynthesis protein [Polycyclovorans sp.]
MRFPFYQVDAFAQRPLSGNPAAVCLLDAWPDDALLLNLAAENNLSETAYLVPEARGWRLRWFTPNAEVALCGHATLAAAQVLHEIADGALHAACFVTLSGVLNCTREDQGWRLDFPALPLLRCVDLPALPGVRVMEAWQGMDTVLVLQDAAAVRAFDPGHALHAAFAPRRGLCVTAPGVAIGCDFVSRFFAPRLGIVEDPVTGSAHCALAPLWAARLGRAALQARQLSARGGEVHCRVVGDRVHLVGQAVTVIRGEVFL